MYEVVCVNWLYCCIDLIVVHLETVYGVSLLIFQSKIWFWRRYQSDNFKMAARSAILNFQNKWFKWKTKWAATCDFQQCGILTSFDWDEPVKLPVKLRNSKWCLVSHLTLVEYSSDKQKLWSDCAYGFLGHVQIMTGFVTYLISNRKDCSFTEFHDVLMLLTKFQFNMTNGSEGLAWRM